jgi:hypothetical protein
VDGDEGVADDEEDENQGKKNLSKKFGPDWRKKCEEQFFKVE